MMVGLVLLAGSRSQETTWHEKGALSCQVQRWVRWHPYNLDAELLWRGTFATFALALFFTAANPKVGWNWRKGGL